MRTLCFAVFTSFVAACAGSADDYPELPRNAYPAGPFGTQEGDTLANHAFLAPDGGALDLQSVRADEHAQVLVLNTAAGWCSACIEEQRELEALYREQEADGLRVLVSLFEDADYEPATPALADEWRTQREVTFAVAADPEFALARYYDSSLTPMNMVVDLGSMQIIRITTGWDRELISTLVEASL